MDNKEIKRIIIEEVKPYLDTKNGTPWQTPSNKKLLKQLNNKYNNWFQGIGELLYLIRNNDNIEHMIIYCPMCGKKNPYFKNHYQTHCCQKCAANDPEVRKTIEDACYKHFGYRHNWSSPDPKLNGRATMKEKTGYEHYTQVPGWKEQCQERARNRTPEQKLEIKHKAEKSYYKSCGCRHNWASKDPKLNGRKTRKERYGKEFTMQVGEFVLKALNTKLTDIDENGLNCIQRSHLKSMETNKKNHGGKHNWASDDPKLNGRTTTKLLYGKESFPQTQQFKDLFKDKEWVDKINQKIYETKKKNGSLKGSNAEDIIYQFLVYKFDFENIEYHYKDNQRYNFVCDFYIQKLDLFIEINFDPSHGFEPFDPENSKHLARLQQLRLKAKEIDKRTGKTKDRYKNFIDVWTIADPIKFLTAKENNLNYLTFYNWEQFYEWFSTLY